MVLILNGQLRWRAIIVICFVCTLNSCMLLRQADNQQEDSEYEDDEENEEDAPSDPFAFPKQANAWETQALLLSHDLPASDQVQACASEVSLAAKEANNDEALLNAKSSVLASVKEDPILYHWCFFLIARQMDSKVEKDRKMLKEKAEYFLGKMKELWILGRALDAHRSGNAYFVYLQRRYVDLSPKGYSAATLR